MSYFNYNVVFVGSFESKRAIKYLIQCRKGRITNIDRILNLQSSNYYISTKRIYFLLYFLEFSQLRNNYHNSKMIYIEDLWKILVSWNEKSWSLIKGLVNTHECVHMCSVVACASSEVRSKMQKIIIQLVRV